MEGLRGGLLVEGYFLSRLLFCFDEGFSEGAVRRFLLSSLKRSEGSTLGSRFRSWLV